MKKLSDNCLWDVETETIYFQNQIVPLSTKSTALIKMLIDAKGRPVGSNSIFYHIWGEDIAFKSKPVRSLVSNLRKKLPCLKIYNYYGGRYALEKYVENISDLNAFLPDILDQAKNGITITDPNEPDNPIIYVNEAFSEIFGYSMEEIIGKNCRFLQNNDKEQAEIKNIRNAIKEEKDITATLRNYHKDGTLIYNEITISPIFDKTTDKVKYFLGVQKDVTNLIQLQKQNVNV